MGDYFLDFRPESRRTKYVSDRLMFFPDMEIDQISDDAFDLTISRGGRSDLWAPYEAEDGTVIAIAGRVALDAASWSLAEDVGGSGGLACKAIFRIFKAKGMAGIAGISGGFAIHIYEPATHLYRLFLDRAGLFPGFRGPSPEEGVYASHADVIAAELGCSQDWDVPSVACYLTYGHVPEPYTYYHGIRSLDRGSCYTFDLSGDQIKPPHIERLTSTEFIDGLESSEEQLADDLAAAIASAVETATNRRLGRTFIALSGGLDSRLQTCLAAKCADITAFSIRGENPGSEFRRAKEIARALGIDFVELVRAPEHYADSAEKGVQIAGGMGNIMSNHFLGFRDQLREYGCENFLTGCYVDSLFKSLSFDTRDTLVMRREVLADYDLSSYLCYVEPPVNLAEEVSGRYHDVIPKALTRLETERDRLRLAELRTFPLCREGDHIQRVVSQRVFDWYAPAMFNGVLDIYRRTPVAPRLGKKLVKKVLLRSIPESVKRIPDNNSERPIDSSQLLLSIYRYRVALHRLFDRRSSNLDTRASWVNWPYYLRSSPRIRELWVRPHGDARALIEEASGRPFSEDVEPYMTVAPEYFGRMLTVKLWAEQRG